MNKFTPGPWRAEHSGVLDPEGMIVAQPILGSLYRGSDDEDYATARLIAAAPDLYQALEGLLSIVSDSRGVEGYHLNGDTAEWGEFDEVDFAAEALKKARGES